MNSSDVRQTVIIAMATFSILMYTYYLRDTEQGGELVHLVPAPKLYDRKKTSASQRDIASVEESVHKTYETYDNSQRSDITRSENISTQNAPKEKSKSTTGGDNGDHFKAKESLLTKENAIQSSRETTCIKQIQFWAKIKLELPAGEYDCPAVDCKARFVPSNSYDRLSTSHAVILHHKGSWKWEELARYRPEGQMWIYMTKESPIHSKKAKSPDPEHLAFNWTMTYRTDSDFVIPYGRYSEGVSEVAADDNRNWATGKTRLVAWMASNCGVTSWGRTKFVKNLKNLIQVDSYGGCGTLKCPRNEKCDEILSSHKFYLALENSECEDYITEKFWKNAFTHHLVPIVYGTTRMDYEKVAPPNSFIHLSDFGNMTSLVDYIKYLDKNDTAYNEYFDWRKRGTASWYSASMALSPKMLCDITKGVKDMDTLRMKGNRKQSTIADTLRMKGNRKQSTIADMNVWYKRSCKHLKSIWNEGGLS